MPPSLIHYASEADYRAHYEKAYCRTGVVTFDGIRVTFRRQQVADAFFESRNRKKRDKSLFSRLRAERIGWIKAALQDASAELYFGWDRDKKRINPRRRITLVYRDYVVVIELKAQGKTAAFITAYVANQSTLAKIRSGPKWKKPKGP